MKAVIDSSGCIGCGLCVMTCPDVFNMGDDGVAEVIADVQKDWLESVNEAVDGCPVAVISMEE